MSKIILLMLLFFIPLYAVANAESRVSPPDTLIEPGKENPQEEIPDTLAQPDTLTAPSDIENPAHSGITNEQDIFYAVVNLEPTADNKGSGRLLFSKVNNGIKITGEIVGLTPGLHGIHIHEFGDCSAPDASSAGGHFNPDQMPHAGPDSHQRHAGDLGNLEANDLGVAIIDMVDTKISFDGMNSIIGKSVVVHAGRDDLKSQPAGDSGGRILCGIIEKSIK